MDMKVVGFDASDSMVLVQDREKLRVYVRTVMNFRVP